MKIRVLTSVGIFIVGIPLLIFSEYITYPIALSLIGLIAIFEMLRVLEVHRNFWVSVPAYLLALALPLCAYFFGFEKLITFVMVMVCSFFVYLLYLFFLAVFMRGKLCYNKICEVFASTVYITASFATLSAVRYMEKGIFILSLVFVTAWGCDVFAYFTGYFFGKHKLIVEISPKKTVEGSLGGIFFATAGTVIFGALVERFTELEANYVVLVAMGIVLSVVAQLGDLVASLIKREHGIKDYGRLLPGHGGIMDRFDSVLGVATPLFAISMIFPPFN